MRELSERHVESLHSSHPRKNDRISPHPISIRNVRCYSMDRKKICCLTAKVSSSRHFLCVASLRFVFVLLQLCFQDSDRDPEERYCQIGQSDQQDPEPDEEPQHKGGREETDGRVLAGKNEKRPAKKC